MTGMITSVDIQKGKKRVNVYIDDEYAFACDAELVYQYKLEKSTSIDLEKISSIVKADNFIKAKKDALYFIEKAYKTEKEVFDKLLKKGYDNETIKKVLQFMKEYNFLDDTRYTDMYVNDKLHSRGKNKIVYDLRKKGIKDDVLFEKISSVDSDKERDTAYRLARKKYDVLCNRETDNKRLYQKLAQFLGSRGYSWDIIKEVLNKILKKDYIED